MLFLDTCSTVGQREGSCCVFPSRVSLEALIAWEMTAIILSLSQCPAYPGPIGNFIICYARAAMGQKLSFLIFMGNRVIS